MRCDIYNGIISWNCFRDHDANDERADTRRRADADDGNGRDGRALRQHCDPPSQARWTEFEPLVQCGANSH